MTESKKGTKWSKEEDEQLISEMKNSMENPNGSPTRPQKNNVW